MKKVMMFLMLVFISSSVFAQNHGSFTLNGKTYQLTGYRTRVSDGKRWIIADGKSDGKLYSVTLTLKPDIMQGGAIKTDATHTVTLTISNTDYSKAENKCFDGGSSINVTMQGSNFSATGQSLVSGDCFGKPAGKEKLDFVIKP